MIFAIQPNLRWYQIALMPVALPVAAVALVGLGTIAFVGAVRDRIELGFWG